MVDPISKRLVQDLIPSIKKQFGGTTAIAPMSPMNPGPAVKQDETTGWNFPPGFNMQSYNRRKRKPEGNIGYATLRNFSVHYTIARACIDYIKTKIIKLKWDITLSDMDNPEDLNKEDPRITVARDFFKHPLGNRASYREFIDALLEDYLVIGAVAMERVMTRGGQFMGELRMVDSSTIRLFIDQYGRIPEPPEPAFAQVIQGSVQSRLTLDDLIYRNRSNRTNTPYGLSPIESIVIQSEAAIQGSLYSLGWFSDGNMPEGFLQMPEGWTMDQIKQFESYFNSMIAGNFKDQRKIKPIPQGAKFEQIKKPSEIGYDRFELWLLQQTCSVFGVPPQDIGFTQETNKSTSDTQQELGQERVLKPTAQFLEDIFTDIIQRDFGFTDLKFVYTDIDPVDKKLEAEVDAIRINSGIESIDEIRIREGKEALGVDHFIKDAQNLAFIDDLTDEGVRAAKKEMAINPVDTTPKDKEDKKDTKDNPKKKNDKKDDAAKKAEVTLWRRKAVSQFKKGKQFTKFSSSILDDETIEEIYSHLVKVKKREQINHVFEPYLNNTMEAIKHLRKIGDELDKLNPKKG